MEAHGIRAILLAGLMTVSGIVVAQPVTVAVPPLAALLQEDGEGVYQRLVARALEPLDTGIQQVYYPYRRSLQAFEAEQVDCLFSLTDVLLERYEEEEIVYSFPLGRFSFHIFTPAGETPLSSVDELDDKVVGRIMGHEVYLDTVLEDLEFEDARSDFHGVRMLRAGRLDALIAAIPDIRPYLDQLSYSPEHPVFESYDRINCHGTERNRAFIEALSDELVRLKRENYYRREAGSLYVPFCENADDDC